MIDVSSSCSAQEQTEIPDAGWLKKIPTSNVAGIETCRLGRKSLAVLTGKVVSAWRTAVKESGRITPDKHPFLIFSTNGQAISLAGSDPAYREIMQQADLVHADGQSVVAMSEIFTKHPVEERSATTDMIHDIPLYCDVNLKHYFLGGKEDVVRKAASVYEESYKENVSVCGYQHGYFNGEQEDEVIAEINKAQPDILWVGLGKPKEQQFCIRNKHKINVPVIISCGGCFNFITGHYKRAPQWMQRYGLEWLHRMASNPGKLFWRYLITNPHALYLAFKYREKQVAHVSIPDTETEDAEARTDTSAPAKKLASSEQQKVLFLLKTFSPGGGVERVSLNLAESLSTLGYRPEFCIFYSDNKEPAGLDQKWPVKRVALNRRNPIQLLKSLIEFRQHVKKQNIRVVISAKETANIISLIALCFLSRPLKIFVRHVAFDTSDQKLGVNAIKLLYCLYALTNSRIVAVSESLANQIKSFLPYKRSKVFSRPNPIINEKIFSMAGSGRITPIQGPEITGSQGTEVLASAGFLDNANSTNNESAVDSILAGEYLCAVGRLCKQKGFDVLLQAYHAALTQKALPPLIIVGEGEDRDSLIDMAKDLGIKDRVFLYGFTDNPYRIMKNASLFILPSRHEGLPTVLVEAIALGVPVVACDCPTGPGELLSNGRHGGLVPVENISSLAQSILQHLEKPVKPGPDIVEKYRFQNAALGYVQLFG